MLLNIFMVAIKRHVFIYSVYTMSASVDGGNLAPPTYTVSGTHPSNDPAPLYKMDDRPLGTVQDFCHWNDFVTPRVHSNVKKGARGEAKP